MKTIGKILTPLCIIFLLTMTKTYAQISVGVSIRIAPPALPVYVQPACPIDGYLWQPGYWAYDDNDGYYWVPGVWVSPPRPGYLWTPAYWGYEGGVYGFHSGYWGEHVGFYGGINYGFGYGGVGFGGGAWSGGAFRYNTAVVNVNTTVVHNTYIDRTVIVNNTTINNRTSFNGPGGVAAQPRPEERAAMNEQHIQPTSQQLSHQQTASKDKNQYVSANHGQPAATALNKINGRPFDQQGHTARATSFGNARQNANNKPEGNLPNAANPDKNQKAENGKPEELKNNVQSNPQAQQHLQNQQRVQQQQHQQNQQRTQQQRVQQQRVPQHPRQQPSRPHNAPKPEEHHR